MLIGGAAMSVLGHLFEPPKVAPHLARKGLLSITRGMSTGDVVSRLGYPLRIEPRGATHIEPLGKVHAWPTGYNWIYASPDPFDGGLSVVLSVGGNQVDAVFVEYDDLAVYSTADSQAAPGARRLEEALP
jgi:hypothetical protein